MYVVFMARFVRTSCKILIYGCSAAFRRYYNIILVTSYKRAPFVRRFIVDATAVMRGFGAAALDRNTCTRVRKRSSPHITSTFSLTVVALIFNIPMLDRVGRTNISRNTFTHVSI